MAKKSKTQRAKASAARAARKEQAKLEAERLENQPAETATPEKPKKSFFKKSDKSADVSSSKKEKKPKKQRFKFFHDVATEMKRVTWPSRKDVIRWSLVVVGALIFFGVLVFLLDSLFKFVLVAFSGLGV